MRKKNAQANLNHTKYSNYHYCRAKIGFVLPAVTHSSIRDVLKSQRRDGTIPERHIRSLIEDGYITDYLPGKRTFLF